MRLAEIRDITSEVLGHGKIDRVDLSLWDARKLPVEENFQSRALIGWFIDMPRKGVRLGASGKIATPKDALDLLNAGVDFVFVGRAAILHHDWPRRAQQDPAFEPVSLPVRADYLSAQGLGPRFIRYMRTFNNFVA